MNAFSHSAFLKALGWALLNSLWQFGLLWLIFVLLANNLKKLSSSVRHGIALLLMSAGTVWFAASLSFEYFAYSEAFGVTTYTGDRPLWYAVPFAALEKIIESNLPYLSGLYLLVVGALFLRFFRYYYHSHRLTTKGLSKISVGLRLHVLDLVQQLGIRRKVKVWVSQHVDTPMVLGYLKPTILIPLASINQLTVPQLEAILLHELAHIKRNDYLINLYIATTDILFFFNPFSRMLINAIKMERENSCDDWVLQFRFDPYQYASALLSLEKSRSSDFTLGIAATGNHRNILLHRIQRIMNVGKTYRYHDLRFTAYLLTISLLCFVAFVNPGNVIMKDLAPASYTLNDRPFTNPLEYNNGLIRNSFTVTVSPTLKKKTRKLQGLPATALQEPAEISAPEQPLVYDLVETGEENGTEDTYKVTAVAAHEQRDYSIPEVMEPALPPAVKANAVPFVPASSFSAYYTFDTVKPIRLKTYNEHSAIEALAKAQKAVEKLDWVKIQKQLSNKKTNVALLKKQIEQSLKELNWQQINEEVHESMEKENLEKMRMSLKVEYENMNKYKAQQQEYIRLKTGLQQQQELYKKDAETKLIEIQQHLAKKKAVVHI